MHRILKALMMAAGVGVFNSYRRLSLDLLKIKAATVYVQGVQTVRCWWIGAILISLMLLLLAAGFVMVHVGLFLWLPWAAATKAAVLLFLGLIYIGIALVFIVKACSEKTWMEISQADKLVESATRES